MLWIDPSLRLGVFANPDTQQPNVRVTFVKCRHGVRNCVQSRIVGAIPAIEQFDICALGCLELYSLKIWKCKTRSPNRLCNCETETRSKRRFAPVSLCNIAFENHGLF